MDEEKIRADDIALAGRYLRQSAEIRSLAEEFGRVRRAAVEDELRQFADWLGTIQPSPVQVDIAPEYNSAIVKVLKWAANMARKRAQELQPP